MSSPHSLVFKIAFKDIFQPYVWINRNSYFSVDDKPRMKRFTPPRNARGSQSESDYSDSDSDSYYSSSYT